MPKGTKATYQQTAGWNKFSNIVEAGPDINEEWLAKLQQMRAEAEKSLVEIDSLLALGDWWSVNMTELKRVCIEIHDFLSDLSIVEESVYSGDATAEDIGKLSDVWNPLYYDEISLIYPMELTITSRGGGCIDIAEEYHVRNSIRHIRYLYPKPFSGFTIEIRPSQLYVVDSIVVNGNRTEQTQFWSNEIQGEIEVTFRISDEVKSALYSMSYELTKTEQFMENEEMRIASGKEYEEKSLKDLGNAFTQMRRIIYDVKKALLGLNGTLEYGAEDEEDVFSELYYFGFYCDLIASFRSDFQYYTEVLTVTANEGGRVTIGDTFIENTTKTIYWLYPKAFTALEQLGGGSGGILGDVTISPNPGYLIKSITEDGEAKVIDNPDQPYTIYAGAETVLVVVFEPQVKPQLTLTAQSYTREYGEENPDFTFTADRDDYSGTPEITCEATAQSPVGIYPIVISRGSVDADNLSLQNGTLTITKAPLTIVAEDKWMRQGEALPTLTARYDGFKLDETENVLTVKPQFYTTATSASPMGDYAITPSNAQAQNYNLAYVDGRLTIIGRRGDVNRDSYVNATDLADVIQYILGYRNLQAIYDADLNGDEQVTIADVTEVINCIMGSDQAASRQGVPEDVATTPPAGHPSFPKEGSMLDLSMSSDESGLLMVSLQNNIPMVAFQFDVLLPMNADIGNVSLSDARSNGHMITTSQVAPNRYRVLAYAVPNSTLLGFSGLLATLQLTGVVGEVTINNIHFADDQGLDYALPSMTLDMATGVNAISNNASFDIYDLNGRIVRRQAATTDGLERGLYIINHKKVIIK